MILDGYMIGHGRGCSNLSLEAALRLMILIPRRLDPTGIFDSVSVIIEAFDYSCKGCGHGLLGILTRRFAVDDFMSSKKLERYKMAWTNGDF
jgi:hypothetical protein